MIAVAISYAFETMSRFPRFLRLQLQVEDTAKVDRIVGQAGDDTASSVGVTAGLFRAS